MMTMWEQDPALVALKATLPDATWQGRLEAALAQHAVIMAVREAQARGESEQGALARIAPGLHRSTFRHQVARFERGGLAGLVSHSPPPPRPTSKVTPEAHALICGIRAFDPHASVEGIAAAVKAQYGLVLSPSVIKRELVKGGKNRPRGGDPAARRRSHTPNGSRS